MKGQQVVLKMKNIVKEFPGTLAVDHVDLEVRAGEVHALMGENGAGKSTLMKILAGSFEDYKGEIEIEGKKVKLSTPAIAKQEGISMIYQELSVAYTRNVAENLFAGRLPGKGVFIDKKQLHQMAEAYQFDFTFWNPNGDLNQQNQLVDKAIAEKPDLVFISPLDAQAAVLQFKKLYDAGIPIIAFNMIPTDEAMQYALCWTGPDDFGQFRKMSKALADEVNGKGGVAYVTHLPGGSPYFARTYGPISTFASDYPDMKTLDIQSPGFDAPKVKQVVSDWITKFGEELTCIVLADDSAQAEGTAQALEAAGRRDIKVIAAGNSKVGMDLLKEGKIYAITYQSAEADGALPVKIAADYFNGVEIPPVAYLPQAVITQENVDQYMPAQW